MYKSKRTHIAVFIIVILVVLLGIVQYIKTTYTVRTVYVEGNIHYSEEEVKEMVMKGILGDNSLYLSLKYKNKDIEGIPFVEILAITSAPVEIGYIRRGTRPLGQAPGTIPLNRGRQWPGRLGCFSVPTAVPRETAAAEPGGERQGG